MGCSLLKKKASEVLIKQFIVVMVFFGVQLLGAVEVAKGPNILFIFLMINPLTYLRGTLTKLHIIQQTCITRFS